MLSYIITRFIAFSYIH